jgi:glycerate dehydrogenase
MKKGAYFINTARGGVICEQALVDALESEHLSGAGIDVLTLEPMRSDCVLKDAKNITITPHVAWAPLETRERLLGIVMDNIEGFLNGTPKNIVN